MGRPQRYALLLFRRYTVQSLKEQQIDLSSRTMQTACIIKQQLSVLVTDINRISHNSAFFSFDEKSKKTRSEQLYSLFNYNSFETSKAMSILAGKNAKLASLLIAADKAMDIELITICEKKFNAYEKLEKDYYEYITNVENEFTKSILTANFLIKAIQKLELQLDDFINAHNS